MYTQLKLWGLRFDDKSVKFLMWEFPFDYLKDLFGIRIFLAKRDLTVQFVQHIEHILASWVIISMNYLLPAQLRGLSQPVSIGRNWRQGREGWWVGGRVDWRVEAPFQLPALGPGCLLGCLGCRQASAISAQLGGLEEPSALA